MSAATRLEPLAPERARELFRLLQDAQQNPARALALDDHGRVTGVVAADDQEQEHLLRDLDVHA